MSAYIAPLDGLRAVAVLIVLLFHVNTNILPGGFVGVDTFFVISGFIITNMILLEVDRGEFSYAYFLKRRFARLIPSLLATVAVSTLAAFLILTPRQLTEYAASAVSALLSVSNIFFYFNSDYFSGDASTKPLLHTWSLGVEEQFYLLWPAFLLLLSKLGRRRFAFWGIAAATVFSVVSAAYISSLNPAAVFYLTPFRVYQLGIGALIATSGWMLRGHAATIATCVGAACILLVSITAIGGGHYLYEAVLPAVAAGLFILGMASPLSQAVFGNIVMTAVGRRAYSIYLVHWPLIVLSRSYVTGVPEWLASAVLIVGSIALGSFLHWTVETPLRLARTGKEEHAVSRRGTTVLWGTGIAQTVLLAVCVLFWTTGGFGGRYADDLIKAVQATQSERGTVGAIADFGRCSLTDPMPAEPFDPAACLRVDPAKPTIAVLGDSFGIETVVGLRDLFGSRVHVAHASYAGCAPTPLASNGAARIQCQQFNKVRYETIKQNKYDAIVLTGNWREGNIEPVTALVKDLSKDGTRVFVVGVRAVFDQSVPDILVESGSFADANRLLKNHLLPGWSAMDDRFRKSIESSGGQYIEMLVTQCSSTCDALTKENDLIYFDSSHLTRAGAAILAKLIQGKLAI